MPYESILLPIEAYQNKVGILGIEPRLLPYQSSFLTFRRYANIADSARIELTTSLLERDILPLNYESITTTSQ